MFRLLNLDATLPTCQRVRPLSSLHVVGDTAVIASVAAGQKLSRWHSEPMSSSFIGLVCQSLPASGAGPSSPMVSPSTPGNNVGELARSLYCAPRSPAPPPAPPSPRPAPTSGEDEGTITFLFISKTRTCVGPSSPDIALLGLPASRTFTPTPFIPGLLWNTTTK
ncbi:hypothetical protein D9756_011295 [Leucocoprinus leucothites]|uniref:Uncharacterized protein n=1 Tax=Leucocoprinus leucothites TaxID=201217 RepID=A0A8H5CND1_9AGAR|nr:hypothetical protein D9756_011295 [Leucoagaricus leucothites]